jgi:hypothetical protein
MSAYYILRKSTRKDKKLMVLTPEGHTVHFGSSGYEDYSIHKNPERRERYIIRHKRREHWNDPETAGFWALHVLWGVSPDIKKCIRFVEKKYNLKIKNEL